MKQFVCNTKIISGENALDALKTLDAQKVLVVTDPFFMDGSGHCPKNRRAPGQLF